MAAIEVWKLISLSTVKKKKMLGYSVKFSVFKTLCIYNGYIIPVITRSLI